MWLAGTTGIPMTRIPARAACALVLATAAPAAASPPSATPAAPPPAFTLAPPPGVVPHRRSPGVALGLSLGVTAGGAALVAAAGAIGDSDLGSGLGLAGSLALLVGPTTGHWYANRVANPGLGVRAVSASVGVVALTGLGLCAFDGIEIDLDPETDPPDQPDDDTECSLWGALVVTAGVAYVGGTLFEIATAPAAARKYNREYGLDVQVAPTAIRAGDGSQAPGLAVAGHF
jgi:hypothetical protein